MMSITRWHNSESSAKFTYVDNIQRVAGREMVTKVDKDQNVYVNMNELSRHLRSTPARTAFTSTTNS